MHMIGLYRQPVRTITVLSAQLGENLSGALRHKTCEDRFPILRYPHEVIPQLIGSMSSFA
jgi:hypothetical protein